MLFRPQRFLIQADGGEDAILRDAARLANPCEMTAIRLMTDEDLYNRLKALIEDTDTLVRDFREHPQKYINVKVFDWGVGSQK